MPLTIDIGLDGSISLQRTARTADVCCAACARKTQDFDYEAEATEQALEQIGKALEQSAELQQANAYFGQVVPTPRYLGNVQGLEETEDETSIASKAAAQYSPNGSPQEHCSICTHFTPPDECERVEGAVRARGWCRFFRHQTADAFNEADHPRGQPGNAGEFAKTSGGAAANKPAASAAKPEPASAKLKPAPADRADWPDHIKAMRVPPAWTDVQISHDPNAALQVIGSDAAGRKQYIYARHFAQSQSAIKYARIQELAKHAEAIQAKNRENQNSDDPSLREHADVAALVMHMGIRPGSTEDTKAAQQAYGATTLEGRHVKSLKSGVRLRFVGKKGVALDLPVDDAKLAAMLSKRAEAAGPKGLLFPQVSAASLLGYVHEFGEFKSKDFRTLLATKTAMAEVKKLPAPANPTQYKKAVKQVATVVSEKLGNTPTVALQSYIAPAIFAEWQAAAGVNA